MKSLRTITLFFVTMAAFMASAHDFECSGIYYNIISAANKEVEITGGEIPDDSIFTAPETVEYGAQTYRVTQIGEYAFKFDTRLKVLCLPYIRTIAPRAFRDCTSLVSVSIPAVTSIGTSAFLNCRALKSIDLSSVTDLGFSCFHGCSSLSYVELNRNARIDSDAFEYCALTSINLKNVAEINSGAFKECKNLKRIKIENTTPVYIHAEAFDEITYMNAVLVVPDGCKDAYRDDASWGRFQNVIEESEQSDKVPASIIVSGGGRVTFGDYSISSSAFNDTFTKGEEITFGIEAFEGHALASFMVNDVECAGSIEDSRYTVTVADRLTVAARFAEIPVYLDIRQADNGSARIKVDKKTRQEIIITPSAGWHISAVMFNGTDVSASLDDDGRLVTPQIMTDSELTVVYESDNAAAEAVAGDELSVSASGTDIIIDGCTAGTEISISDVSGMMYTSFYSPGTHVSTPVVKGGVYIVRVGDRTFKLGI